MDSLFSIENIVTLGMLILLQAVLGFDNLLYISLESKRAPEEKQAMVRKFGIGLAVFLRIVLLVLLLKLLSYFQKPIFEIHTNIFEMSMNFHSLIVLLGGIFILYTAIKEIFHMMILDDLGENNKNSQSTSMVIAWIVIMNLVFSFDSILSAIALTDEFWVMAIAIVIGGILMIWLSDRVTQFLNKNRIYEVLGLFILLVVGIMLLTEGGHLAHIKLFGNPIIAMSKTTFYFIITILVLIDIVQNRFQKKLMMIKKVN